MCVCAVAHIHMCTCLWRPEGIYLWMSSSGTQSNSLQTRSFISLELTNETRLAAQWAQGSSPALGLYMHATYTWLLLHGAGDCLQGKHFTSGTTALSPAHTSFLNTGPPCVRNAQRDREKVQPGAREAAGRWEGSAMERQERWSICCLWVEWKKKMCWGITKFWSHSHKIWPPWSSSCHHKVILLISAS